MIDGIARRNAQPVATSSGEGGGWPLEEPEQVVRDGGIREIGSGRADELHGGEELAEAGGFQIRDGG